MSRLPGRIRLAVLLALPLVVSIGLVVHSQAVARLDSAAAREAVVRALAALPAADALAPTAAEGAEASPEDAADLDKVSQAFLGALRSRDFAAAWELTDADSRGAWTLESWRESATPEKPSPRGQDGPQGSAEETMFSLMGRQCEVKEVLTRGPDGVARVAVHLEVPVSIAMRRAAGGEWQVDLTGTNDLSARQDAQTQLKSIGGSSPGETFLQMMMMAEGPPGMGAFRASPSSGTPLQYTVTSRRVAGDRATIALTGVGEVEFVFTLSNEGGAWKIDWERAPVPITADKPLRSFLDKNDAAYVGSAKEKARQASCQSNLKQIALGWLMYCQDYDERTVPVNVWRTNLMPYIKNESIFACPSDRSFRENSYAINNKLSRIVMAEITSPAATFLNFESDLHVRDAYDKNSFPGMSLATPPRHNGGNNYSFADGHVKWVVTPPKEAGSSLPPYPDAYRVEKTGHGGLPGEVSPPMPYPEKGPAPLPPPPPAGFGK